MFFDIRVHTTEISEQYLFTERIHVLILNISVLNKLLVLKTGEAINVFQNTSSYNGLSEPILIHPRIV